MPFSVECPECRTPLEVDDEHREWKVRCPQCRHEFRPVDAPAADLVEVAEDDDAPRPRRRRRRRREYEGDPEADPEVGAREIAKPALALELTGWASLVLTLAVSVILVVVGVAQGNQPRQPKQVNDDPPELFIFMGVCLGVFAVPYFAAIAIGARKARNLTSHSWGIAAAVMAIAAIVLFGLCGLPIIVPGIWLIVVMNNDDVKAAFKQKKRRDVEDEIDEN